MQNPTLRRAVPSLLLVAGLAGTLAAGGCSGSSKPRPFEAAPIVRRDVPEAFRNTIGAEATIGGIEPVLVSGYGFVVGLHGTGGQPMPEPIAATMERTLGLNGVNAANPMPGLPPMSPRDLLRHPDTAVVVVQAAIPPGAPRGTRFDVAIEAINADSLDGGRLWTTELRLGPPAPLGGHVTQRLATALGEVFENPFREPGSADFTSARVLNGGVVTEPFDLVIQLDSPSHARARQIASAINSRFPDDDGIVTARGVDDSRVGLHVPAAYSDRPDAFLNIVTHLPIDWQYRREYAQRYVRAMKDDPALARELAWCLVACNEREVIRELYDSPDLATLMGGLLAGAELGDPLAADPLRDLAARGPLGLRAEAIRLLGFVPSGVQVDLFLREQSSSPDLVIRTAAYEALSRRAEQAQTAARLAAMTSVPAVRRMNEREIRRETEYYLPGQTIQGIARRPIMGQQGAEPVLTLDRAPFGSPLVYVTMHRQPKITLFGEDVRLTAPLVMSAWDNRLMIASDPSLPEFRVYFRHPTTGAATVWKFDGQVTELIAFMARHPLDAEDTPGLALSYSEIVGALHAIHQAGGMNAGFTTERDQLAAQILAATQSTRLEQRPETPTDVPDDTTRPGQVPEGFRPEVVPPAQPEEQGSRGR